MSKRKWDYIYVVTDVGEEMADRVKVGDRIRLPYFKGTGRQGFEFVDGHRLYWGFTAVYEGKEHVASESEVAA